jgi:hypothetical protein
MAKRCIICNNTAVYQIKDTSDYYCLDCAEENFADINILVKVDDEAKKLKAYIDSQMDETLSDDYNIRYDKENENEESEFKEKEDEPTEHENCFKSKKKK